MVEWNPSNYFQGKRGRAGFLVVGSRHGEKKSQEEALGKTEYEHKLVDFFPQVFG